MQYSSAGSVAILHADLDSFYASVEQRDDPRLHGRPVIVGGGVVLAASYEAKAYGVRTPMGERQALALCPQAVVVSPRFSAYVAASRAVFDIFRDTTPLVEGMSIDEAFLDVGGLGAVSGSPVEIGVRLRERVRGEVGLPITVGIARTKFLAKVASASAKPDGLLLVPPEGEASFLHPLPVQRLWGVGKVTTEKLNRHGIRTVADIAALDEPTLVSILGPFAGRHVLALAQLRDPRPVTVGRRRRSMGAQRAMGRGRWSDEYLDTSLMGLVERVTRRLRKAERRGRTVTLRLRFDDFTRATRSHTLPMPTAETALVLTAARSLLREAQPLIRERGVTLIGVAVANLDDEAMQLELPFRDGSGGSILDGALDDVRAKFGSAAISPAALLGSDPSLTVPMLPD